eukprot:jgi/Bigna1/82811/fgenesh1_pg.97_\
MARWILAFLLALPLEAQSISRNSKYPKIENLVDFTLELEVKFTDFNNNYPMIVSTESGNNVIFFHGMGPAYGANKGRVGFYYISAGNVGGHGRCMGDVKTASKLSVNTWYTITVKKRDRCLSIHVNGDTSAPKCTTSYTTAQCALKAHTATYVNSGHYTSAAHILHGDVRNYREVDVFPQCLTSSQWVHVQYSHIVWQKNCGSTTAYQSSSGGVKIAVTGQNPGCGNPGADSMHYIRVSNLQKWTKIKYKQRFYGAASCWNILGNDASRCNSGVMDSGLYVYSPGPGDLWEDLGNMKNDRRTSRCDNQAANFWHSRNGGGNRYGAFQLRREPTKTYAGLGAGTSCGIAHYDYYDIYAYVPEVACSTNWLFVFDGIYQDSTSARIMTRAKSGRCTTEECYKSQMDHAVAYFESKSATDGLFAVQDGAVSNGPHFYHAISGDFSDLNTNFYSKRTTIAGVDAKVKRIPGYWGTLTKVGGGSQNGVYRMLHIDSIVSFKCANEGGTCSCSGPVFYLNPADSIRSAIDQGKLKVKHSQTSISCTSGEFGNPAPGITKECRCLVGTGEQRRFPIYFDLSSYTGTTSGATTSHNSPVTGQVDKLALTGFTKHASYHLGRYRDSSGTGTAVISGLQTSKRYIFHIFQYNNGGQAYYESDIQAGGLPKVSAIRTNRNMGEATYTGTTMSDSTGKLTFTFTQRGGGHMVLSYIGLEPEGVPGVCSAANEQWYYLDTGSGVAGRCHPTIKSRIECASNNDKDCKFGQYPGYAPYQFVPITMEGSGLVPHDTACPGWAIRGGSNACTVLNCDEEKQLDFKKLQDFEFIFDFAEEGLKNSNLGVTTTYYHFSQYAGGGGKQERAALYGWTHLRGYHKGYLRNTNGEAQVKIYNLQPNAEYEFAVFQYAVTHANKKMKMRINNNHWFTTSTSPCDIPSATGYVNANEKGEIIFYFDRNGGGHTAVSAIGIDRGRYLECTSTRGTHYYYNFYLGNRGNTHFSSSTTFTYTSREATLKLVGWSHTRNYQDGFLSGPGSDNKATVSGLKPSKRYHYHIWNYCTAGVSPGWYPCGTNELKINGGPNKYIVASHCKNQQMIHGVATTDSSGKIEFLFVGRNTHVSVSQISIDDYYGGFAGRQRGCAQLQWADDFDKLFNNPEDVPAKEAGRYVWEGDWYGMQNDPEFPKETKDTFFTHKMWQAMTEGSLKLTEEQALVEISAPKIHHWRLQEYYHPLTIQDKDGWSWTITHGSEVLIGRQTFNTASLWPSITTFSLNAGNPNAANYAIFDQLETYRMPDGRLWLKMIWPGHDLKPQIWYQTSNPFIKRSRGVTGYQADSVPYTGEYWGGLQYNVGSSTMMSGSSNNHATKWWYSFGSTVNYGGGMPGPNRIVVSKVEIYALTPPVDPTVQFPVLANLPHLATIKPVKAKTAVGKYELESWLTGSSSSRTGSIVHDADALYKYLACSGKIAKEAVDSVEELKQLHHCKAPASYGGGGTYRGVTYTFTDADCGGPRSWSSTSCVIGIKEARQSGEDEDFRAYVNPPRMKWWMNSAAASTNLATDYLCPASNSRLTSDFSFFRCKSTRAYSGATTKSHTFTSAECGGKLPPFNGRDCLAVFGQRSQSGRDKQWEVLRYEQATTIKWQCPGCSANINAEVP